MGATRRALVHLLGWSDLAGDEGVGVGGVGPESSVGATRRALVHLLGSLKN